jgi:hypothetical protein
LTDQEGSLSVLLAATADVVDDIVRDLPVSRDEVHQLRGAMETRAPIEQARGMLMMRYGLSPDEALHLLLRWSRSQEVELRVLAITLVSLGINEGRSTSHQQFPASPGQSRAADASTVGSSDTTDD